jgi:hypothetical protein
MTTTPLQADRLSREDLETLKKDLVALHPGVWLHHYGRAIEETVLRRHGIAFTPVTTLGE